MKIKRSLALFAALLMVLFAAVGCNTAGGTTAASASVQATATQAATVAPAEDTSTAPPSNAAAKFDPPITITTAIALRQYDEFRNSDTLEDNPLTRWMRDNLGIITKFKWQLTDADNALNTRIQLALSSGEELPDVLPVSYDDIFANLIESGQIQPIDEAFDKYATDRVKYAFSQNAAVWNFVKKDGKKWALPQISDGFVGDTCMWIRQDWLDTSGLKVPTTLEEFEAVLEAFTNKDPDGNGANDTYGVAIGGSSGFSAPLGDWMGDMQFIFGQDQPYQWIKDADGTLRYGSISPVVKQGLGVLAGWFEKGYISPDFITQDATKAAGEFTGGKCGVIFAPGWCGGWPIGDAVTAAADEGKVFNAVSCLLPSGLNGVTGRVGSTMSYLGFVFRTGFEYMDAIFRIYDLNYGEKIEDPDYPFAVGVAEGYDYVMVDGKPNWTDVPGGIMGVGNWIVTTGNTPPNVMDGPNIYQRVASGDVDSVYEQKLQAQNGELTVMGFSTVFQQMSADVPIIYVALPTPTMVSSQAALQKLDEETQLKIIAGEKPLDYFDDFVAQWLAGGGEQITQEVNEWYQQVNK